MTKRKLASRLTLRSLRSDVCSSWYVWLHDKALPSASPPPKRSTTREPLHMPAVAK